MEQSLSSELVATPSEVDVGTAPAFVVDATDLSIVTANPEAATAFGYDAAAARGYADRDARGCARRARDPRSHPNGRRAQRQREREAATAGSTRWSCAPTVRRQLASRRVASKPRRPTVATVIVELGTPMPAPTAASPNGDEPDPGTAVWLVQQINRRRAGRIRRRHRAVPRAHVSHRGRERRLRPARQVSSTGASFGP